MIFRIVVQLNILIFFIFAGAQCTFDVSHLDAKLVSADIEGGFPTKLVSENPLEIQLACQGQRAVIKISPPTRIQNKGRTLKGPFKSYFIYMGKTYTSNQQAIAEGEFASRSVKIGISIENEGSILPASNEYSYQTILTVTEIDSDVITKFVLPINQQSSLTANVLKTSETSQSGSK